MDFKIEYQNERDVEIPLLINFIKSHKDILSVLDVGCARAFYLEYLKGLVDKLDGIDFEEDENAVCFLDHFFQGDFMGGNFEKYDLVSSVSVIEHYGVKQIPVENYQDKQVELVKKIGRTSLKYIFLSFPYGQLTVAPGKFSIVDDVLLSMFGDVLDEFKPIPEFYFNNNPQAGKEWYQVEQAFADSQEYNERLGVCCICVLKGVKKNV